MMDDILDEIRKMAALAAKDLRERSPKMDGTAIIAEEIFVPEWSGEKDYSKVSAGAPVKFCEQVYVLLQPHNAKNHPNFPSELPALWRISHTKDPKKAKPWVKPVSTSDMYLKGECMLWKDGKVYSAERDTAFSPEEFAPDWKEITL